MWHRPGKQPALRKVHPVIKQICRLGFAFDTFRNHAQPEPFGQRNVIAHVPGVDRRRCGTPHLCGAGA